MRPRLKSVGFALLLVGSTAIALSSPNLIGRSLVLAQSTTPQDRKAEGDRLLKQGDQQLEQNQFQKALKSFQQALEVYQALKNRSGEGQAYRGLGRVSRELKQFEQAIAYHQKTLGIAKEIGDRELELKALNNFILTYAELENNAKVVEFAYPASVLARELKQRFDEGWALVYLADAYASLSQYQKAIEAGQQALIISKELRNLTLEASALDTITRAYSSLSNPQKTIEFGQQTLTIARQLKNQFLEGRALAFLADAYPSLSENQKAIEVGQQALVIAKELKNVRIEMIALDAITRAYSSLSNPQKMIEFGQQTLAIARQVNNQFVEGRSLALLAGAYAGLGENQKAIELGQQALVIAEATKNSNTEIMSTYALAYAYKNLKNYAQAIKFAQRSLSIAQKNQNFKEEGYALYRLSQIYGVLDGRDKDVEAAITQGLAIARKIRNYELEIYLLSAASENAQLNGDYKKAIEFAKQGFALAQKYKIYGSDLAPVLRLADLYNDLAAYQDIADLAHQFLKFGKETDNSLFTWIGWVYLAIGQFGEGKQQEALVSSEQALATAKTITNPLAEPVSLALLSFWYGNTGNHEKALALSQQGLAISKKLNHSALESLFLQLQGSIYHKTRQFKSAIETYRSALKLDEESDSIRFGLARTYRDMNMPITAITYYKQAINIVEQERKKFRNLSSDLQTSFLQTIQGLDDVKTIDAYRELADLLLSQGRVLEAQQVLELLKTQEVQDFTRTGKGQPTVGLAFASKEGQISDKSNSLIAFGQRVDECQQSKCPQLNQLLDKRQALSDEFDQQVQAIEKEFRDRESKDRTSLAPQDFLPQAEQIVNAQPGTVLIYPLVLQNRTWILWASKGVVVKSMEVPGVGQKQIGETVLKFRQLLQNPNSDLKELKATGKQLYDWLIKPIEPELKANNIQNLVFSLDRSTRYTPMATLFDGEKFLLERYSVSTVLSAGYTDMSSRPPLVTQNTQVLALGLSEAKPGFNPLPNVPIELDTIVRQANNDQGIYPGRELLNNTFNFSNLRRYLGGYRVVHIATHGKFVPVNPDESFLLLGDGNPLKIPRIRTLQNLRDIDLIVLSACETALGGADQDGVEIAGISSYFLQRGKAKSVMASLWAVSDSSTSLLMQQFYKNLATGNMTKAEALRQAQLSLLNKQITNKDASTKREAGVKVIATGTRSRPAPPDFSHPYYWAPFILIGNSL